MCNIHVYMHAHVIQCYAFDIRWLSAKVIHGIDVDSILIVNITPSMASYIMSKDYALQKFWVKHYVCPPTHSSINSINAALMCVS